MKKKYDQEFLNNMSRDPSNWKGPFYFNRRDPRLMVPKLHPSMGWTLNFASPMAYIAIGVLIAIIVFTSIFKLRIIMKRLFFILNSMIICFSVSGQDLMTIVLNTPSAGKGLPVMQAFQNRASATSFTSDKLNIQDLSDLLWAANGINRPDDKKRTAPSAMNAQDVDVYVFMSEGVYLYDAVNSTLVPVVKGDQRLLAAGRQADMANASVILVMVSDISRFRSGEDSVKLSLASMDAAIVSQNICLFCAGMGLNTRPRATMDTGKIKEILKLSATQYPLMNNPVSYPAK
jgi:SagB-type dehydrogenase family enzyme